VSSHVIKFITKVFNLHSRMNNALDIVAVGIVLMGAANKESPTYAQR
jgi:hypothetical protein